MDEFVVGESVFLKESAGAHIIIDYYPETDRYAVQTPEKSAAPVEVTREDLLKVTTDILERIRQEVLAGSEQQRIKDKEPKPSSRYTDDQVLIARRRARVIEPLFSIEKAGNKITKSDKERAMAKLEIKITVLNDLLAKYRRWSSWESLVSGKSGRRKGATRFDSEVEAIMVTASKEDVTGPGGTVQAGINGVQARCLKINKNPPSPATIRRRHRQNISAREAVANDAGPKVAHDIFDTFDHGAVTTHALQLIHADNSPLDCHATDPKTGRWLGRPNLTLIVDDHTDSYLGFALTFRASSRNTLADAMLMAVQPKDALMQEFGLEGKFIWMQYGAGENYRVDKGSDFNAKTVLAGLDKHGIIPQQRLRPQSGGKVERAFGKINPLFMQRLRGAIASNRKMRRGENPQSMATYTITDLFVLIITQICIWHEYSGSDQLTPNQRWRESFGKKDGKITVPRRISDPSHFWIDILHEHHISVHRGGLKTIGLVYEAGPYKNQVGAPVRLKIDHNNIHHAWVEFESKWVEVQLINNRNADIPRTMWAWDIKRNYGQKAGQLTILGLFYVNIQRNIITDTQERRLEESRQLQERVLSSLAPGLLNNAAEPSEPTDLATTTTKGSHVTGTPHGRSTSQQRGPAPPMMGDDDL
ncbi:integrase [Pseudomonas protegens]|uniref:integrase n=1 Tax=Pseudomonas protegens TaxID=380021 RepID=UPI0038037E45